MRIKLLALANGDYYDNVLYQGTPEELRKSVSEGDIIDITMSNKQITINTEFIISYELEKGSK